MRILIDYIPGGYDAEALHAEIDQTAYLQPYAIWWPEHPGEPLRVEVEREVTGAEAIVRDAAARAAVTSPFERSYRAHKALSNKLIDLEVRRAAASRLGFVEEERALAEEIAKLR